MSSATLAERLAVIRATGRFPDDVVNSFGAHLTEAPEEALFRMNPLQYAQAQGLPERLAIDLFLHATHAGILGFTWGILCPACVGFLSSAAGLRHLGERECTLCELPVSPSDDNVEVAFTVAPSIRRIRFHEPESLDFRRDGLNIFFSTNRVMPPLLAKMLGNFAESVLQVEKVSPGEPATLSMELPEGEYRLFAPAHHAWSHFEVRAGAGAREERLELMDGRFVPRNFALEPGRITLHVDSRVSRTAVMGVVRRPPFRRGAVDPHELQSTLRPYLTGKMLVTSQTFRELFHAESLPNDSGFEFKSLTVLFTDLKGSTELYGRVGDFRAYGLVREHFDLLRGIIAARGGSMVKTIGDAVMASFAEPLSALKAAAEMNQAMGQLGGGSEALKLKIGLHTGPCIAVELNERLDYFGQTVNLASRVQGAAEASEIVCTESVFQAPGAQEVISASALSVMKENAQLKGVDGAVTLFRMR